MRFFLLALLASVFVISCSSSKVSRSETSETALQKKYASLIDVAPRQLLIKTSLLKIIDEWYGTRYKLGGTTKAGVDCSAFVQIIYTNVYRKKIPRTAGEQFKTFKKISKKNLKEGDLVFFNTSGKGVSHVGLYLQNGKFVHASTSKGVRIDDLNSSYFQKNYIDARGAR